MTYYFTLPKWEEIRLSTHSARPHVWLSAVALPIALLIAVMFFAMKSQPPRQLASAPLLTSRRDTPLEPREDAEDTPPPKPKPAPGDDAPAAASTPGQAAAGIKYPPGKENGFWGAVPFREGIDLSPADKKRLKDEGRIVSEPAESAPVAMSVEIDSDWKIPAKPMGRADAAGAKHTVVVTFANTGKEDLVVNMYDTWSLQLTGPSGNELKRTYVRDATRPAAPLTIAAGKKATRAMDVTLEWQQDRVLIAGGDGSGGSWYGPIEKPGRYKLSLRYENKEPAVDAPVVKGFTFWTGKLDTQPLEFKISE